MTDISLNASMRTNLLSLQQISKLQDQTQLRLSTGLKVNSAIDNPSSYYTAQSLTNRANDLSALLDAMGQGVQTIKAANEGIEKATELLDQMKAVVEQVSTEEALPDKAYFVDAVGENGAVVSTAQELRDAITSGKETICVYGKIDLGDISTTGGLSLQENQKLVGVNYFGNFKNGMDFSSISATDSVANHALIDIQKTGCLVSDLSLNYSNSVETGEAFAIRINGSGVVADVLDLNINAFFSDGNLDGSDRGAIGSLNGATANISGNINIESSGKRGHGIHSYNQSTVNIQSGANVNIKTSGSSGFGMLSFSHSTINIQSHANVNIETSGQWGYGIFNYNNAKTNISGNIKIRTTGIYGYGISNSEVSKNSIFVTDSANIYLNTNKESSFFNAKNNGSGNNILEIASGAKIAIEKNGNTKWYEVKEDYKDENTSTTAGNTITADNIETKMNVSSTSSWQTPADIITEQEAQAEEDETQAQEERKTYQSQFNSALSQFDMLINDSSYKGINLLKEDKLKVNFNEDKSAFLNVNGMDLTSEGLGMLAADWSDANDVQNTLNQIMSAKDKLRSAATKLGNYYSIITERDNFTDNLINVLEEGADKLTLADMNEESANMLALQTQQQLAINSLSLASQASQGVLRLF